MNISLKWRAKQISDLVSKVIFTGTPDGGAIKAIAVIETRCRLSATPRALMRVR